MRKHPFFKRGKQREHCEERGQGVKGIKREAWSEDDVRIRTSIGQAKIGGTRGFVSCIMYTAKGMLRREKEGQPRGGKSDRRSWVRIGSMVRLTCSGKGKCLFKGTINCFVLRSWHESEA